MNSRELRRQLIARGISEQAFSLDGYDLPERYVLSCEREGWSCYYFERGNRAKLRHFPTEEEACEYFLSWVSSDPTTRGRDGSAAISAVPPPTEQDLRMRAEALLRVAPGPAPWFVRRWAFLPKFAWAVRDRDRVVEGVAADGRRLVRVPFYWTVLAASESSICLLSNEATRRMILVDFPANTPDMGPIAPADNLEADNRVGTFATSGRVSLTSSFLDGARTGIHATLPIPHNWLPEVLAVPGNSPKGATFAASLYIWRAREGSVRVVPLPWFTDSTADLGYQWITRCAFDSTSGWVFGDGIRMSPFAVNLEGDVVWGKPLSYSSIWSSIE